MRAPCIALNLVISAAMLPQMGCGGTCRSDSFESAIRSAEYQMWLRDGVCDRKRPASGVTPSAEKCPKPAEARDYKNRCFRSGEPPVVEEATFVRYEGPADECLYAMRITHCTEGASP